MSEWDFLWGLEGQELMDAMSSGGTYDDWAYIERMERQQYGFDDDDYYDDDYYDEPSAKKNTMVFIDAKKVLNENKSIDIFVIVSRDGDYTELVRFLRSNRKRVVILAPKNTSKKLKNASSESRTIKNRRRK